MDGDPVTGEPSPFEKSDNDSAPNMPYTAIFTRVFPEYLAMGMTYKQFWREPSILAKYYRDAFEIRRRQEEWARWRQGAYVFDALLCAAPVMRAAFGKGKVEPGKYPDSPWPLTEKEMREQEEAREKERYERYIANMNAASERELKRRAEEAKRKEATEDGG